MTAGSSADVHLHGKRVSPIENPLCAEGLVLLLAKTLFLVVAAALMPLLITAKSDKQSIRMLEGRLLRLGGDRRLAAVVYWKHRRRTSDGLAVVGLMLIAAAIFLYGGGYPWFLAPGLFGVVLTGAGIWGISRSFAAAAKEVDELAASSTGTEK